MSSVIRQVTVLSLFILAVRPDGELLELKCQPTVGIIAQTTVIRCQYKDNGGTKIYAVSLWKSTKKENVFKMTEDNGFSHTRFSLENPANGPSLKIAKTMFSDEGNYFYQVLTNKGEQRVKFSFNVTAKYSDPITTTWPKILTEGGPADLYCNATDGYPAGFIHWFDSKNTNWTINSELTKVPKDIDGKKSVALSSKLTFKSISLHLEPFRCVVYNSKYVQDGESTVILPIFSPTPEPFEPKTTNIIAGVMVIGSLIVGLLFALLIFRRKRHFHNRRRSSANPMLSYDSGQTAEADYENP